MGNRIGVTFCGDSKIAPYEFAVAAAGLEPVRLTADGSPCLEALDGLLLTGGVDVNPARYGQERGPETDAPDDPRDRMECELLAEALRRRIPVLAICRGLQLMNVHLGGTLHQHLDSSPVHVKRRTPDDLPRQHPAAHSVVVDGGTRLASIIGSGGHEVNSRHHQAVDRLGRDLKISARSADGVVEGLELGSAPFVVAVQWHPEDRIEISAADRKLFEAFAAAAREPAKL
jgi:putative glutamine amidotransferase